MPLRRLWPLLRYWRRHPPMHLLVAAYLAPPESAAPHEGPPLSREQIDETIKKLGGTPWQT